MKLRKWDERSESRPCLNGGVESEIISALAAGIRNYQYRRIGRHCTNGQCPAIYLLGIKPMTIFLSFVMHLLIEQKDFPFELKSLNSCPFGHVNMKKTRRRDMDMEIDMAFAVAFVALIAGLFLGPISKFDEFLHHERNPWENGQDS